MPGELRRALHSVAQRKLVQSFLEERAVEGHSVFQSSLGLSVSESHALEKLVEMGFIKEYDSCKNMPHGTAWQLSKQLLEHIRINMILQFPWSVFTRRSNVPLEQATCFELMLTLKSHHWTQKSSSTVRKKKDHPPFLPGFFD